MSAIIGIYGSRRQEGHIESIASLLGLLRKAGVVVCVHPKFYDYLRDCGVDLSAAERAQWVAPGTSLVLSIGGDGTFLRTAHWVGDNEIPVLGVNTGHLGFLAGCNMEELPAMLDSLSKGKVAVQRRMILEVSFPGMPPALWPYALNDVSLLKEDSASMISVKTVLNGCFLADYRADGLIISTPTGSTAYNLSAGGPILEPTLDCMVLSPVAPHSLTVRPLVIGGGSELEMTVESRTREFRISLDGHSYSVRSGGCVKVKRASFSTLLVRGEDSTFAGILRDKLNWNR